MITIRSLNSIDANILKDMLYHAIYIPPGQPPVERDILKLPEIHQYIAGWGREGDWGFIALDGIKAVGAIWLRLWQGEDRGYGYISPEIPELTIALLPEYRDQGIGTHLVDKVLTSANGKFQAISLSVDLQNPAIRLYQRKGFIAYKQEGDSLTMICRLPA